MDAIFTFLWDFLREPNVVLIWSSLAKTIFFLVVLLFMVSYGVYAERKICAAVQDRIGPNRTGIPLTLLGFKKDIPLWGLFQPIADPIKVILKEYFMPKGVNKFYYWIAPQLVLIPAVLVLAVLPFGSTLFGQQMVIANLNVGVLFVFAVSSLSVYGIVLAGWASNSKYPFLGGIRSSAQMISYELALGLSVVPVFLVTSTLNLQEIVHWQADKGWMVLPIFWKGIDFSLLMKGDWAAWQPLLLNLTLWFVMIVSFVTFLIAMFAETNRAPFDLPEAEQELVGGYHTEYSGMGFAMFQLAEYSALLAGSGVIVTLFLGGWSLPFGWGGTGDATAFLGLEWTPAWLEWLPNGLPGLLWGLVNIATFFVKMGLVLCFFIWVRWTVPRFRYDQLMKLGWYVFFELALLNIFIAAFALAFLR